jgi:ubiquinone biosynthesis protein
MITEAFQIDPQELAAVVPDCYAEFRPIVAEGVTFFIRHLSPQRLEEIFQAEAKLPADTTVERRLVVFLHACPVLHKIGQVLARHRHLDAELRRHLQELESMEPHTPLKDLRPVLANELAPAVDAYRIRLADRPLAEGSVAVVMPLTWADPADGSDASPRQGVAKVLKPGIVPRVDEDLLILGQLAGYLTERWVAYGLPPLAYREIFHEVAQLLVNEVWLRQEQTNLRLAGHQFAGQPDVHVPRVLPFCTDGLTAMERVYGYKPTDPRALAAWRRPALFQWMVRALLSGVLFSREESLLFHGDPHAGNLLVNRDGRLAILDWSLAGTLTSADRLQMAQILVGGWARDAGRILGAVTSLARAGTDEELLRRHVQAALAQQSWCRPPGPLWPLSLLDTLACSGVRFPPRLLLFRKAFLTLEGVLADLCPDGSLELTLTAEALKQLTWEWPLRWCKPLDDHDYATHVSSADLLRMALGCVRQFP